MVMWLIAKYTIALVILFLIGWAMTELAIRKYEADKRKAKSMAAQHKVNIRKKVG